MLILLFLPMVVVGCGKKEEPPKVVGISVGLQTDKYIMTDNRIKVVYGSDDVYIKADDFKVSLKYSDGSSMVIRQNNLTTDGFSFSTNLPMDITPDVGEYTLTFKYQNYEEKKIVLEVIKADFVFEPEWDYTVPYYYDGIEKIITLKNLPTGVFATYTGNRQTEVGKYMAVAELTHINQKNYNPLGQATLEWEIIAE